MSSPNAAYERRRGAAIMAVIGVGVVRRAGKSTSPSGFHRQLCSAASCTRALAAVVDSVATPLLAARRKSMPTVSSNQPAGAGKSHASSPADASYDRPRLRCRGEGGIRQGGEERLIAITTTTMALRLRTPS
jgi:hypothetical protein